MANPFVLSSIGPASPDASASRESRRKLEESCRQFESFFMAEMMKRSKEASAVSSDGEEQSFRPLEETALEMSARSISEEGEGLGLWRVLYDGLCESLPEEGVRAGEEDGV